MNGVLLPSAGWFVGRGWLPAARSRELYIYIHMYIHIVSSSLLQVGSWDAVGCLLLVHVNQSQRELMASKALPLLSNFFQRVQVRHQP